MTDDETVVWRRINPLNAFLSRVKQAGLKLDTVYDIGAHKGSWSLDVKQVLPDAQFFLFEANREWLSDIEATGMHYCIGCLSDPGRHSTMFFRLPTSGATYYQEATTFQEDAIPTWTPTITVDDAILIHHWPPPDLIKLDTQGSELDILAGATKALETVTLIQTELPLMPYNIGAPKIGDYFDWFRSRNFLPVLPLEMTSLEDVFVHMDFLFMRRDAKEKYLSPTEKLRI